MTEGERMDSRLKMSGMTEGRVGNDGRGTSGVTGAAGVGQASVGCQSGYSTQDSFSAR